MRSSLQSELEHLSSLKLAVKLKTANFKVLNETLRRIILATNPTQQAVHALGVKGGGTYLTLHSVVKTLQRGEEAVISTQDIDVLKTVVRMLCRWSIVTLPEKLPPFPVNLKDLDIVVLKFNDVRTKSVVKFDYKNNLS